MMEARSVFTSSSFLYDLNTRCYVTVLGSRVSNTPVLRKVLARSEDHADETDERRAVGI